MCDFSLTLRVDGRTSKD